MISDRRKEKFKKVAAARQRMTVILENVHDPHNIGAVLRSCDAVGIQEIYILYTEDRLQQARLEQMSTTSTGVKKWMQIHFYRDVQECFTAIKKTYDLVLATHLDKEAKDLHALDLKGNIAFLFGNEHEGLSEEALSYADGNFIIPQFGMVQSLNISVACAITLYEALRQRKEAGMYLQNIEEANEENQALYKHFVDKHNLSYKK